MIGQPGDEDRLFRVLCARALQRHGQGFPSMEDEIRNFERTYVPSPEEQLKLPELIERLLTGAQEASRQGEKYEPPNYENFCTRRQDTSGSSRAAARGAQGDGLSPEMENQIQRMIDDAEDHDQEPPTEDSRDGKDREDK